MKTKFWLVGALVAGGLSAASVAAAAPILSQTSLNMSTGQSITITSQASTPGVYLMTNSNPVIASIATNGTQITVNAGNQAGSTNATICYVGASSDCATLAIVVGATGSGGGAVTFDKPNPTVAIGNTLIVTISGGSQFYVATNSNLDAMTYTLNSNIMTIIGKANGTAVLSVCNLQNTCSPLTVNVGTATSSGTVTPAVTTPAPVVVTTPTPAVTGTAGDTVALLTQIQTMQNQLAQMLTAIQAMQAQLAKLASSAASSVSAGTSASASASSASTVTATKITSLLKLNSTGSEVTLLQQKLTKAGYYSGPVNGSFGPLTEAGLKKYQTAKGIEAAGYTGPATRSALNAE